MQNIMAKIQATKVEWKTVGDIISKSSDKARHNPEINFVYAVSKEYGIIPSIDYWQKTGSSKRMTYQIYSEDTANYNVIRKNMFAYNPARLNIGSIGCLFNGEEGLLSPMYVVFAIDESLIEAKYLWYFLKSSSTLKRIDDMKEVGARFRFDFDNWRKIKIPLPPLEIQEKIVKVLDKFTEYVTELKAELKARLSQYDYYRDKLLSEEYLARETAKIGGELQVKSLGEVGEFENGAGLSKKLFDECGDIGAIHYGHIYTRYELFVETPLVKIKSENAKTLKKVHYGDLVIAKTSENVDDIMKTVAYLGREDVVTGGHAAIFRHKENPRYLAYVFNGYRDLIQAKNRFARGVKVIELSTSDMAKIKIPLPPLAVQDKIVAILDKFYTLTSDIAEGLPREIELREKQYEYYRDKLLSFT